MAPEKSRRKAAEAARGYAVRPEPEVTSQQVADLSAEIRALREELKAFGAKTDADKAADVTHDMSRAWADLPAEEQEYIWRMVEERKRFRERTGDK